VLQARAQEREGDEGPTGQAPSRFGFTASKRVGKAVDRNRARRRLKAAARELLPRLGVPGADYVFIARMDTAGIGWQRLLDDMESALISLAATLKQGSGTA